MKKLAITLVLALIATLAFGSIALAGGPNDPDDPIEPEEPEVILSDIDVPSEGYVGDKVTASGTVTIIAEVDAESKAESEAGYIVNSPSSEVDRDSNEVKEPNSYQNYEWSFAFTLTEEGNWVVIQYGKAEVEAEGEYKVSKSNSATITALLKPEPEPKSESEPPDWGCPDQFYLRVGLYEYHRTYHWVGGYRDGIVIRDDISLIGRWGRTLYRIEIEALTEMTANGKRSPGYLIFKLRDGEPYFEFKALDFSKPVKLFQGIDGKWVEILSFTKIVNHRAQIEPQIEGQSSSQEEFSACYQMPDEYEAWLITQ